MWTLGKFEIGVFTPSGYIAGIALFHHRQKINRQANWFSVHKLGGCAGTRLYIFNLVGDTQISTSSIDNDNGSMANLIERNGLTPNKANTDGNGVNDDTGVAQGTSPADKIVVAAIINFLLRVNNTNYASL